MLRNFQFNVWLKVLLLSLSIALLTWLLQTTSMFVTEVIVGFVVVYQIYDLVQYVERTNRRLANIFEAIRYSDFTRSFSMRKLGTSFDTLDRALNEVINSFQKAREEKEETLRYLETVVQHVGVGLLVYNQNGDVETVNSASKKILGVNVLRNINQLEVVSYHLLEALKSATAGDNSLIRATVNGEEKTIALSVSEFRRKDSFYKLVSLKNIQSELESKEFEAWQNLTRVMTHEIVNSITPISSLSNTVNQLIENELSTDGELSPDSVKDIQEAIQVISRRSEGLSNFIDSYRKFSRVPKPRFEVLMVKPLLEDVLSLYKSECAEKNIRMQCQIEPVTLEITADRELVELALINLTKNALQAVANLPNAEVQLIGRLDGQSNVLIQVTDNGKGIIPEALDKVFIPFFSTKQGGSGIGLSLSRQIMHLHRGTIRVESIPDVRTTFTLRF
ncbi:MAG: ATP-binding protein [Spirosomataceae bacterium]